MKANLSFLDPGHLLGSLLRERKPSPPPLVHDIPAPTERAPFTMDVFGPSQGSRTVREPSGFSSYLIDQGSSNGCGTACAAMLANFWRQNRQAYSREQVDRTVRTVGFMGSTPQNVADWFNQNGFRAAAVNHATLDSLTDLVDKGVPVQVLYDLTGGSDMKSHFVNVVAVQRGSDGKPVSLRVADPSGGRIHDVPVAEFQRRWANVKYENHHSGYDNAMVVALPKENTAVRGADGTVRMTDDIALPPAGGFSTRARTIDFVSDVINDLGRLLRPFRW